VSFVGNFQFLASLFIDDFLLLSHVQNISGLIQVYFIVATVALSGKFEQRWLCACYAHLSHLLALPVLFDR